MKKLTLLALVTFMVALVSCSPSVKEALSYNDTIVYYHQDMDKKVSILSDTYNNYVPEEMDSAYQNAINSAEKGIEFVKSLGAFHGDDSYQKAAQALFEMYKSVVEVEHARIIGLLKLPANQFQQAEINELEQLKDTAAVKIQSKIDETAKVQELFAKKYKFPMEEEKK